MQHSQINEMPKYRAMQINQYVNYLAIDLLEKVGNDCPTQDEIDFMESMIKLGIKKYQGLVKNKNHL